MPLLRATPAARVVTQSSGAPLCYPHTHDPCGVSSDRPLTRDSFFPFNFPFNFPPKRGPEKLAGARFLAKPEKVGDLDGTDAAAAVVPFLTQPSSFSTANHGGKIQGGAWMTAPPRARHGRRRLQRFRPVLPLEGRLRAHDAGPQRPPRPGPARRGHAPFAFLTVNQSCTGTL